MALGWSLVVLCVAGIYAWLMESLRKGWDALPLWKPPRPFVPETKVSILVPVRNEEAHLESCLLSLIQQDYPAALREIIVIDDFSEDGTAAIARDFAGQSLRLIRMAEIWPGGAVLSSKKKALQAGIQAAKGKLIVTFDGDSWAPSTWLSTMVSYYEHHHPVLLAGPVLFSTGDRLLAQFQALDMCGMTGVSAAGISRGWFHLGNGANLCYEKEAFLKTGGFEGTEHLASGDDVFTMQKMARTFPGRLAYVKSPEAVVQSAPAVDWKAFWDQRLRWGGKASHYKEWQLTAVAALTLVLCWCVILSFFLIPWVGAWAFLFGFGIKSIADYRLLSRVTVFFRSAALLLPFWKAQLFHVLYIVGAGTASVFLKKFYWKGRKLR